MIEYSDFEKVEVRVGKIVDVQDFPEARKPAYKLKIDFGEQFGLKRSSVQIIQNYTKNELMGKKVLCVTNFKPKQIANFSSEVLTLGIDDKNGNCVLIGPDSKDIKMGERIY
jgi:tRNA-binding protein